MIDIVFHKKVSLSIVAKIEVFIQSFPTVGLHQLLSFSQAMEPTKDLEYCFALNEFEIVVGYCIIHKRFPIISIQDGPLVHDDKIFSAMITAIKNRYKTKVFAFTTVQLPYNHTFVNIEKLESEADSLLKNFFSYPTWVTIIIETSSLENIEATFQKGNVGTNIRKAEKKGLSIDFNVTESKLSEYANLYDSTYKSRNIQKQWKNSKIFFTALLPYLNKRDGFFIAAYYKDKMVGGGIFLASGNTLYYKYGASDRTIKGIPIMHSIIYQAVLIAKKQGFSYLDLCGINPDAPEGSQVNAITMFKKSFGGRIISSPKRIYLANNRISLAIVLLLLKLKKSIHK